MPAAGGVGDGKALNIFLIAIEESGDALGASLMDALRHRLGAQVQFSGVGGTAMASAGLASLLPIENLAIIGVTAIPRRLPAILRHIRQVADAAVALGPAALVIIDSPDFSHRVARRVRKLAPSIPIVNFVSPSVWAWRPRRASAMRAYVDHVLALLPFEPAIHAKLGGPACTYVGHPLIELVDALRPNAEEAKRRWSAPPQLLVLPGSRGSELRRHLPIFGDAVGLLQSRYGAIEVVLPTLPHFAEQVGRATAGWAVRPRIVVERADKQAAFRTARAALAKSGTVTLELALAGIPMVTAYKFSRFEEMIMGFVIKVPTIILANLVLGEELVPEFLHASCTAQNLAQALLPILDDTPERRRQVEAFARLDAIMEIGRAKPSERAADIVVGLAKRN